MSEFTIGQMVCYDKNNKYVVKIIGVNSRGVSVLTEYNVDFDRYIGGISANSAHQKDYEFDVKYIGQRFQCFSPSTAAAKLSDFQKKYCEVCLGNS